MRLLKLLGVLIFFFFQRHCIKAGEPWGVLLNLSCLLKQLFVEILNVSLHTGTRGCKFQNQVHKVKFLEEDFFFFYSDLIHFCASWFVY